MKPYVLTEMLSKAVSCWSANPSMPHVKTSSIAVVETLGCFHAAGTPLASLPWQKSEDDPVPLPGWGFGAVHELDHRQGLLSSLASPQEVGVQCPVCRDTLVYDLCALKAAPPPQHPLVRDGGSPAQLCLLTG